MKNRTEIMWAVAYISAGVYPSSVSTYRRLAIEKFCKWYGLPWEELETRGFYSVKIRVTQLNRRPTRRKP